MRFRFSHYLMLFWLVFTAQSPLAASESRLTQLDCVRSIASYSDILDLQAFRHVHSTYQSASYNALTEKQLRKLEKNKLRETDFDQAIEHACIAGKLPFIRKLHKQEGLTADDFRKYGNLALQCASGNGHLSIVEYLHREVGLTADDFRAKNNYALRWASRLGHLAVVEYLHRQVELTEDDFRRSGALKSASRNGQLAIVEYLHQQVGLAVDDVQGRCALAAAIKNNHTAIVGYLRDNGSHGF